MMLYEYSLEVLHLLNSIERTSNLSVFRGPLIYRHKAGIFYVDG